MHRTHMPLGRLAHDLGDRAMEAGLIRRVITIAQDLNRSLDGDRDRQWERMEDLGAVLTAAVAMLRDLEEEIGRAQDRALDLQEGPSVPSAPDMPAAA